MPNYRRFEDLPVWQDARKLVKDVYLMTKRKFGNDSALSNQMQRSAISIMANIAEGFERGSDKDFSRFLNIAKASCGELRSHFYIAFDLNYIDEKTFTEYIEHCINLSKQISGFSKYLTP